MYSHSEFVSSCLLSFLVGGMIFAIIFYLIGMSEGFDRGKGFALEEVRKKKNLEVEDRASEYQIDELDLWHSRDVSNDDGDLTPT